jgi:hypothetical protein
VSVKLEASDGQNVRHRIDLSLIYDEFPLMNMVLIRTFMAILWQLSKLHFPVYEQTVYYTVCV